MITSNILQRTFQIQHAGATGTCFSIDVENRQYLITAKHVVDGLVAGADILVHHAQDWKLCLVSDVWFATGGADVAVISPTKQVSPTLEVDLSGGVGSYVSQEVYFLGFPYGFYTEAGNINNDYPIPFVKRGIISGFTKASEEHQIIFVDGHNNPGFSGGPLVTTNASPRQNLIGVISGYQSTEESILLNDEPTGLKYNNNTGLVIAYGLEIALNHIRENPTGAPILQRPVTT
jgi:S1-C subfamily serine protease